MECPVRLFLTSILLASTAVPAFASPRAEPVTETVHGITLTDEYRWMEDPANEAEMVAWVKEESKKARAALEALPERAAFAKAIREASSTLTRYRDVQMANGVTVFRRAAAGDKTPKLLVRDSAGERVLIDPNTVEGSISAINNVSLSHDGKLVAVHQARGGGEIGEITVYETATGKQVGEPIGNIWGEGPLVWLGGDWVGYTQIAPEGTFPDPMMGWRTFIKKLGDKGPGRQVFGIGSDGPAIEPKELPFIGNDDISNWIVGVAGGARADQRAWAIRRDSLLAGGKDWVQIADLPDKVGVGAIIGDTLYNLTTKGNGNGVVTRRGLLTREAERPLFEGDDRLVLNNVIGSREGLYVFGMTDGVTRLFFSAKGDAPFAEVKLPFEGGDVYDVGNLDSGGIYFGIGSWLNNVRHLKVVDGKVSDGGFNSETWPGAKDFAVTRLEAKSADGTAVPLVVVHKGGALPKGGMPTILEAYGGYGVSTATPFYNRDGMAWVARGGAAAYCGVRGGGERGRGWHEGGRSANKPRGHEDFIACARTLKEKGIAPAKGPVGTGTSMGGALAPPAVLKSPSDFAGVIPRVGVVNATRIGAAPNGANQFDEMGDPATPDGFKALVGMDAYQMLSSAKALPPTLITIGLNDKRVTPWMSAKFAARAKAKFPGSEVWLRADDDAGHGIGTAEEARVAEWADTFAWAWHVSTK
jgi:prolyl oligopeptidase